MPSYDFEGHQLPIRGAGSDIAQRMGYDQTKEESVIYYRKPAVNPVTGEVPVDASWVTFSDSQDPKQLKLIRNKGFEPLDRYGRIEDSSCPWAVILSSPDGRREFPVDQIVTFRWYEPTGLRRAWPGLPREVVGLAQIVRLFPQLAGQNIEEFPCPECHNKTFLKPSGLAHHLRIHHEYDRVEIIAVGKEMGLDFSREFRVRRPQTITFEGSPEEAEPEENAPEVTIERRVVRGRQPGPSGRFERAETQVEEVAVE